MWTKSEGVTVIMVRVGMEWPIWLHSRKLENFISSGLVQPPVKLEALRHELHVDARVKALKFATSEVHACEACIIRELHFETRISINLQ